MVKAVLTLMALYVYVLIFVGVFTEVEASELHDVVYDKTFTYDWTILKRGTDGELRKTQDTDKFAIDKKGPQGDILFYNNKGIPIIPGNTYTVKAVFTPLTRDAKLYLMLSMPGSKRISFLTTAPVGEPNKPCTLRLQFKANEDEKYLRIHLVTNNIPGVYQIESVSVESFAPAEAPADIIQNSNLHWGISMAQGAEGILKNDQEKGSYIIEKNNSSGIMFFYNSANLKIIPGKSYEITAQITSLTENTKANLMLSMPGAKRKSFPTSISDGDFKKTVSISLKFIAQPDESNLRIHLVMTNKGIIQVNGITIKEKTIPDMSILRWNGENLCDAWMLNGCLKKNLSSSFVGAYATPGVSLSCDSLKWDANAIKAVEVKFRAYDEGGYLQLEFKSEYEGREFSSFQTMSTVADGEWHTLYFPVSEDRLWRGQIKAVKLLWQNLGNAEIAFSEINALPEKNLIPDAVVAATSLQPVKIPLIRPRCHYQLSWNGNKAPNMTLSIKDRYYKEIQEVHFNSKGMPVDFYTPEMTVTANLSLNGNANGYPILKLMELPPADIPDIFWRGAWIWVQNEMGPEYATIWFKKEFELSAKPETGSILMGADDRCDFYLNGTYFPVKSNWENPQKIDITNALKIGRNELVVKVFNGAAWGGLIAELYAATVDGRETFILSDKSWTYHYARPSIAETGEHGDKIPTSFKNTAVVIGKPPVAPWGKRLSYSYIGPMGKVKIVNSGENEFTAEVIKAPTIKTNELSFKIELPDGKSKIVQGHIVPSTEHWERGKTVKIRYDIPAGKAFAGTSPAKISLATDYFSVVGNDSIGTLNKMAVTSYSPPSLSSATICGAGTRPYIIVNGEKIPPIYFNIAMLAREKNPNRYIPHIRNAVAGGSRIVLIAQPLYSSDIWKSPSEIDFSSLDATMNVIAENAPGMYVMICLQCSMPDWWLAANPDDTTMFYGGIPRGHDRQSLASAKWLSDVQVAVKKYIEHIKNSSYGNKVIGVTVSEGWNSEWFWGTTGKNGQRAYSGFAPAAIKSYRNFLREKYKTDELLAKAWGHPEVKVETVLPPSPDRQKSSSEGGLMNPVLDRDIIDYFEFRNRIIANDIEFLCKTVKEETNGRWLTGAYYGYLIFFSYLHQGSLQDRGHMAISQIAKSPYIDYVFAPSHYLWRRIGLADSPMQPADTFSVNGKLVIVEQDLRSFTDPTHTQAVNGKTNSVEETIGCIDRAFGMQLARGLGTHWYDMNEVWLEEKVLLDLIKSQVNFYNSLPPQPTGTTPVEVCFISDTESVFYTKSNDGNGIHQLLISDLFRRLNEAGFAFRHVLLSDILEKGKVPPHKLYVTTNTLVLDALQRNVLRERFKQEKASVVWLYGPGIYYPDQGPSADNLTQLLGIKFTRVNDRIAMRMSAIPGFKPERITTSVHIVNSPWFLPVSGFDNVIAKTSDGKPAMVSFRHDNTLNYFSAVPNLSPEMLRYIARNAGVTIFCESNDPVHVGNDFIILHAKTGGEKTINIPSQMHLESVIGPLYGNLYPGDKFNATAGRTYGFRLVKNRL